MQLLINGIGIYTSNLSGCESLLDVICDRNFYDKHRTKEENTDTLAKAIYEAGVEMDTPVLYVADEVMEEISGVKISSVAEALKIAGTMPEAAIICAQRGMAQIMDIVVIRTTTDDSQAAYAIINEISEVDIKVADSNSVFRQLYGNDGPVCEAGNVICGCYSVYYHFIHPLIAENDCLFELGNWDNYRIQVNISNLFTCKVSQSKVSDDIKKRCEYSLIPISFKTEKQAKEKLTLLLQECSSKYIDRIMKEANNSFRDDDYIVAFIAKDSIELSHEIGSFLKYEDKWTTPNWKWTTRNGSCYNSMPVGDNKICMMNPPGGSLIKGAFYRLYRTIPQRHEKVSQMALELDTSDDLILRYSFEIMTTKIILNALMEMGIQPNALLGGSMGEIALPLAMTCIRSAQGDITMPKADIIEHTNIIVREIDELLKSQGFLSQKYFKRVIKNMEKWYLKCDLSLVKAAVEKEGILSKVFITIIGGPQDVIITGAAESCARVIGRLKCFCTKLEDPMFAHTPILEHGRKKIKNVFLKLGIHLLEDLPYDIYSTSMLKKMDSTVEMYADNFANCIINQVNMPAVFDFAYNEGCRVFVDLGTSPLCSQWARDTFKEKKDVLVLSVFEEGNCKDGILHIAAQLLTNKVKFNFDNVLGWFNFGKMIKKEKVVPVLLNQILPELVKEPEIATALDKGWYVNDKITNPVISVSPHNGLIVNNDNQIKPEQFKPIIAQPITLQQVNGSVNNKMFMELYFENIFNNNHIAYVSYLNNQKTMVKWIMEPEQKMKSHNIVSVIKNEKNNKIKIQSNKECLYDYGEVLEMTNGSMAKVLGEQYEEVDKYAVRARMPSPPFMFITRILKIDGRFGELTPGCSIEAEYDVKEDCIMSTGETEVSPLVFGEASHIGIFLAGYLGIDAISHGTAMFRVTDTETIYQEHRIPQIGETARLTFTIQKFIKNGDMTLIFCDYKVFLNDILCIAAKEIGGFFTKEILDNGAGIKEQIKEYQGKLRSVPYQPICNKRVFEKKEVHQFLSGHPELCFGNSGVKWVQNYRMREEFYLLDRIVAIENSGGMYGLGYIIGEKEIDENFWAYQCHFKNDPILPATIMMEGVIQISIFFQMYQGLLNGEKEVISRFEPGNVVKSTFRGQVRRGKHQLKFRIDVKDLTKEEYGYRFAHDSSVFCDGVYIISQKNAVLQINNKGAEPHNLSGRWIGR